MPAARHPALQVLGERDARFYILARIFGAGGQRLVQATIPWHVYDLTGSTFALGVVALVQFLPVLPTSLWGGVLADSFDRRRIAIAAQAVSAALALGLFALTRDASGAGAVGAIYAAVFALSVATSFENPAGAALLPQLVPRELFPHAVSLLSTVRNAALTASPMLAGFSIAAFGAPLTYALGSAALGVSIVLLSRVRPRPAPGVREPVSLGRVVEGVRFVRGRAEILSCMTLDMFAVVFASVVALLPVYQEILGLDARGYGLLAGGMELGTVVMGVLLVVLPPIQRPGRALLIAVGGFGLATLVFGVSRSFPLSFAALVLAGMADQVSMVTRSTIIQLSTPDALRGRVSSVNMVFINASNQLGAAESSFLAHWTSPTFSVEFGGIACLAVLVLIAIRVPALRRYRIGAAEPDAGA